MIITQVYPYKSSEQSGVVKGKVIDAKGNPLQYVNVFFTDGMEGAMTDENGCFEIRTSHFGKRILRISHIGYEQKDIDVIIGKEAPVVIEIILEESFNIYA